MRHWKVRCCSGGTPKDQGEQIKGAEIIRRGLSIFFLLVGMISLAVLSQPIRSEAKEPCQSSDDGIPKEIKEYCEEIGEEFGICPELLEAIAWHESRFIPDVTNKNCYGLCQVNVKIHADRIAECGYTAEDMLEPYPNIYVAADYLFDLYETYGDDNPIVLTLYSGGGWKAVETYKEYGFITKYVESILTRSATYERLHEK